MTMTVIFRLRDKRRAGQALPKADFRIVSPSYFDALHIPFSTARILQTDRPGNPDVAVVNRSAVNHLWDREILPGRASPPMEEKPGPKWLELWRHQTVRTR